MPSTDLWYHLLGHHSCWWLHIRNLRCRNRVNWLRECTTWSNDWASCGSSCWYEGWWLALFAPRICLIPCCWNKGGLVIKTLCCFKRYPYSPSHRGIMVLKPPSHECLKKPRKNLVGVSFGKPKLQQLPEKSCVHFLWIVVKKRKDNLEQISKKVHFN